EHEMEVIVPDDQLSLAIGKKGQNVKLAARLTGWKLNVRSQSEVELEHSRALESLRAVEGISDMTAELLYQQGFKTAAEVAAADVEDLLEVDGLSEEKAAAILQAARDHLVAVAEPEAEPEIELETEPEIELVAEPESEPVVASSLEEATESLESTQDNV
ncbi:MAG: transcription termination/antitermination protein NusA, partial [Deltaproteobacteria bacterium]|nr:transcription termination/antitermination protein NusA [Deltaproteobacteria bacterium]